LKSHQTVHADVKQLYCSLCVKVCSVGSVFHVLSFEITCFCVFQWW